MADKKYFFYNNFNLRISGLLNLYLIIDLRERLVIWITKKWCPGAELNHRHEDFQSSARATWLVS